MVLVDTSVRVHHLREGNPDLVSLLNEGQVMCHEFIIGEIACGRLKNWNEILSLFNLLPMAIQAKRDEVLEFIEDHHLMGRGLGYMDMHLSASAILTGVPMWTMDRRLDETNKRLGISYRV
jgi:predicted nucleic acid-binding protein